MKPKIAILSIRNTYSHGGVLATIKTVYKFCSKYFDPTIFVLSFDKEISAYAKGLKFRSSTRETMFCGMKYVEVGARWAFWEPGHYAFTAAQWKKVLTGYDYFLVVSATSIAGHPLVLLKKRFPIWISTSYEEDRKERVKRLSGLQRLFDDFSVPAMRIIEKDILNQASFVWALSSYSKVQFEKIWGKLKCGSKKNLVICPQPIERVVGAFREEQDSNMIISVGRFSDPRKNITMLLNVFEKLYQKKKSLRLHLVGQRPTEEELKQFLNFSSFSYVTFHGPVEYDKLVALYRKASVKLITSHQEGFGIAGLETLSYGVPIVSTDCGGVRDFVINGHTGYLVAIDDVDAMVDKVFLILSDDKLRKHLSENAIFIVKSQFSEEKVFSIFKHGLVTVYPELKVLFSMKTTSLVVETSRNRKSDSSSVVQ
jgi:glycosyltransferase involved in cell wall biosynthesis